ncbi:hypothetical protein NHP190012_10980 [Helicobacter sp. NHP19-012]|uniref:beta-lactamase n=1 Tax=Helicobacter gastrofelis TaxID=2849642 RepID=A0ABM7SF67_9HELI|nr:MULTISPECIES: hypothetical protein [unclassified Helicobacter]BCZ19456.1 hypothetical protein NHP190012_10980 [Helicobacter sp. NHP19-012]GMB96446.1 hypothetical protein NHP22001_10350 [Helicobacter sp. NHP22-001]
MEGLFKKAGQVVLSMLLCLNWAYANKSADQYSSERADQYFEAGLEAYKNNNYLKALQNFQEAAKLGDPRGYYDLAVMYKNGIYGAGFGQDKRMAQYFFQKACDLDHQFGCRDIEGTELYQDQNVGSIKSDQHMP